MEVNRHIVIIWQCHLIQTTLAKTRCYNLRHLQWLGHAYLATLTTCYNSGWLYVAIVLVEIGDIICVRSRIKGHIVSHATHISILILGLGKLDLLLSVLRVADAATSPDVLALHELCCCRHILIRVGAKLA